MEAFYTDRSVIVQGTELVAGDQGVWHARDSRRRCWLAMLVTLPRGAHVTSRGTRVRNSYAQTRSVRKPPCAWGTQSPSQTDLRSVLAPRLCGS